MKKISTIQIKLTVFLIHYPQTRFLNKYIIQSHDEYDDFQISKIVVRGKIQCRTILETFNSKDKQTSFDTTAIMETGSNFPHFRWCLSSLRFYNLSVHLGGREHYRHRRCLRRYRSSGRPRKLLLYEGDKVNPRDSQTHKLLVVKSPDQQTITGSCKHDLFMANLEGSQLEEDLPSLRKLLIRKGALKILVIRN